MDKVLNNCGFGVTKTYSGQIFDDKQYVDIVLVDVVRKIGEGENDFVIEKVESISYRDVDAFIAAQADLAGVDAYLKRVQFVDLPGVEVSDDVTDYTGLDLLDEDASRDIIKSRVAAIYKALPADVTAGLTPEEFVKKFDIGAYLQAKNVVKEDVPEKEGN